LLKFESMDRYVIHCVIRCVMT